MLQLKRLDYDHNSSHHNTTTNKGQSTNRTMQNKKRNKENKLNNKNTMNRSPHAEHLIAKKSQQQTLKT